MRRLRIAISQRCDAVAGRDEIRDSLDVRLSRLVWALGFLPCPLCSGIVDPYSYLETLTFDGLLLSGGNDIGTTAARDNLESAALMYAIDHCIPVMGICRGMQMLNHFQGGSLQQVTGHIAVKHSVSGPLLGDKVNKVNSYHNQGIYDADLGRELFAVARSDDGVVEALRHHQLPWLGVMWHPEREITVANVDCQLIAQHFMGKI